MGHITETLETSKPNRSVYMFKGSLDEWEEKKETKKSETTTKNQQQSKHWKEINAETESFILRVYKSRNPLGQILRFISQKIYLIPSF